MSNHNEKQLEELLMKQIKISRENLWANIFHDTIKSSRWLKEQPFSPGRAAIGYPTLYALYRILDELQPRSILEMGLGQSTKMIGSYVRWQHECGEECKHFIVEHDKSWIDFFKGTFELSEATEVLHKELVTLEMEDLQGAPTKVNMYRDFTDKLEGNKFDLIFIDGPFGSPVYSRVDIIDLLPECLADSFVLMLDDAERQGEQNTLQMILSMLKESGISSASNYYSGEKATAIITSEDLHFFCTM